MKQPFMRWSVASVSPLLDYKLHQVRNHVPPSVTVHIPHCHTAPGLHQKTNKCSSRDLRKRSLYSAEDTAWRRLKWRSQLPKAGWLQRAWRDTAQPLSGELSAPLPPKLPSKAVHWCPSSCRRRLHGGLSVTHICPQNRQQRHRSTDYVPRKWNHF